MSSLFVDFVQNSLHCHVNSPFASRFHVTLNLPRCMRFMSGDTKFKPEKQKNHGICNYVAPIPEEKRVRTRGVSDPKILFPFSTDQRNPRLQRWHREIPLPNELPQEGECHCFIVTVIMQAQNQTWPPPPQRESNRFFFMHRYDLTGIVNHQ